MPQKSGPVIPDHLRNEYPFPSHSLDLDGIRLHYVDEGLTGGDDRKETLLFVHGNPTWSFAWRHFLRDLSVNFRVIAVDHVGCGFSDKPQHYDYRLSQHIDNLVRLIQKLDLHNVTLVAHDWGGAIGMGAATRMPERFSRFVLMNTAAFRSTRIPLRIAVCRIPLLGPLAVRGLNLFAKAALRMAVVHHDRMTREVRAGFLAPYGTWKDRIAVLRFVQDIPLGPQHPSYVQLAAIEAGLEQFQKSPMLLVWAEQDWCFTLEFLEEFRRRFPGAEVLRIADAGHYVFEDAHERIIPRLREFLKAHPLESRL